jgi:methyl-accepting chemotaxis protein
MFFTMKKDGEQQLPPEVEQQMQQGMAIIQQQKALIDDLKAKINEMKANIQADIYKADKSAETAITTAEMNNSSKEMITVFQSAIDALVASQQGIVDRISGLENMEVDLSPVIEAMRGMMNPEQEEME